MCIVYKKYLEYTVHTWLVGDAQYVFTWIYAPIKGSENLKLFFFYQFDMHLIYIQFTIYSIYCLFSWVSKVTSFQPKQYQLS